MSTKGLWNIGGFNLPDFGITEGINKVLNGVLPQTWNNANIFQPKAAFAYDKTSVPGPSGQVPQYVAPASQNQITPFTPYVPAETGGINGGGTGGNGSSNPPAQVPSGGENGGGEGAPSVPSIDEQANWIFQDLDNQVAQFPQRQQVYEGMVNNSVADQEATAANTAESTTNAINTNKTNEVNTSTSTLRELAQNANDLLQRINQLYGGGSPAEAAMTGMGKTINMARGNVISARDASLRELDNKLTAVNTTYQKEKEAIGRWKDEKMLAIQDQVNTWASEIAKAKTNVRAQLSQAAVENARTLLAQLAQEDRQYNQTIDLWKTQRAGELEDYKAKLAINQQYNPATYSSNVQFTPGGFSNMNTPGETATDYGTGSDLIGSDNSLITSANAIPGTGLKYDKNGNQIDENGNIVVPASSLASVA